MRNKPTWALLLLIVLPALSQAGEAPKDPADVHGINIGTLSQVQSETMLYKAQAERAAALRSINGPAVTPVQPIASSYFPQPMATSLPGNRANTSQTADDLPVVKMISGPSRAPRATLLYSSGYEFEAQTGADLPGGYKLASVSLDSVILTREGKRFPLGFSSHASQP